MAVAAVAWLHWERGYQFGLPFGAGVHLFYVLSGFLITSILLGLRETTASSASIVARFYVRRALRIMPAFYLTLTMAALVGVPLVRESWAWHAAYLSNVYIFDRGTWPSYISHFWSLAVEEQFYLVWPFVILFAPARWIGPAIVGAIVASPIFRWLVIALGYRESLVAVLVPGSLDSLGIGALLAWVAAARHERYEPFVRALLRVGLPAWLLLLSAEWLGITVPAALGVIKQTFQGCVFAWLVARAADGFKNWFGRALESSPVTYLGRISYGVYLAHGFAGLMVSAIASALGLADLVAHEPIRFVLLATVTVATATMSWHLVEAPINALKDRFSYQSTRAGLPSTSLRPGKTHPYKSMRDRAAFTSVGAGL